MAYTLVDDQLIEQLEPASAGDYLFLEPHPEFEGQWKVNCYDPHYYFDFKDEIGSYRAVSPNSLESFMDLAEQMEYKVAFFDDPATILDGYAALNEPPDITLTSSFEGTINGLLPYQVQGYNMLKDLNAGVARWDTGTGKTVLAGALLKHHQRLENFDTAFIVTKKTNKVNTQRKLLNLAEVESAVVPTLAKKELVSGTYHPRREFYEDAFGEEGKVVITNYETFRVDQDEIVVLFHDRRILLIWDEMPTKLSSRGTQLYQAVKWCLFDDKSAACNAERWRPSWVAQYMLSATPIENSPEGWFNCMRLMDPTVYGTVSKFESEFVTSFDRYDENKPATFHKLDKVGLMASHLTHEVDKEDLDIAEQFPEVHEEIFYVEWEEPDRKLYNELLDRGESQEINPIALISLLQMVCDEPTMLTNSALVHEAWETAVQVHEEEELGGEPPPRKGSAAALEIIDGLVIPETSQHGKQMALQELLEKHAGEKTLIFSALNESLMPTLEARLNEWKVPFVRYNGTEKQRQAAEDRFMEDPDIWVFLTSDMGSDSLDLYVGQNVINYNLPWKWSTKIQRQNRIHRASSTHAWNRVYTLVYSGSIEERKDEVILMKKGYHDAVFKGAIKDKSMSARMTAADLYYILGRA